MALKETQIMQKASKEAYIEREALEEAHIEQEALKEAQVPENCEISVSYVHTGKKWDRNNIVISNIFAFQVVSDIIKMMKIPNHEMWKNVDIEMIDQNGKKQYRQS